MKKPVAAPAVYRAQTAQQIVASRMAAQPRPTALQPKMASVPQVKPGAGAPPVYKPQPLPKVLQPKSAAVSQSGKPQAPPPYRPMPKPGVLQAKPNCAAANCRPQAPANQRVIQRHSSVIQMYDPSDKEIGHDFLIDYHGTGRFMLARYVGRATNSNRYVFTLDDGSEIFLRNDRIIGYYGVRTLPTQTTSSNNNNLPKQTTPTINNNNSTTTTSSNKKRKRPTSFGESPAKKKKSEIVTRILREDQPERTNMGINTTRKSRGSFERNLPQNLTAFGGGKTNMSRLYSYMRKYGGAGMQGYHKDLGERPQIVKSVLEKMNTDKNRKISTDENRKKKFTMVAIDTSQLPPEKVFDLNSKSVKQQFLQDYSGFPKMYERHRREGVVVIKGHVPHKAVVGLRSFYGVPSKKELKTIIGELADEELEEYDADVSSDEEPVYKKFNNNNGPQDPPPGASGMAAF